MMKTFIIFLNLLLLLSLPSLASDTTSEALIQRQHKSIIDSNYLKSRERQDKTLEKINTKEENYEKGEDNSQAVNMIMNSIFNPYSLKQLNPNY